jgi:hypothetical protein
MSMRVEAIGDESRVYVGYYNLVRRKPGDVFDLLRPKYFSEKWMKKVDGDVEKTPAPGEPSKADLVVDGLLTQEEADGKFEEPEDEVAEASTEEVASAPKRGRGRKAS